MPEQIQKPELILPEGLEASRLVGQIPTEELPWMAGSDRQSVGLSELTFSDGTIYLASAVPPGMEKITEAARAQDPRPTPEDPYTRLDKLMLLGCHLEATGQSGTSRKINLLQGDLSTDFEKFSIRSLHESPKSNTRRIYYAYTDVKTLGAIPESDAKLDSDIPVLVRIAATDKDDQVKLLKKLTKQKHQAIRNNGAGSV